MPSPHHKNKALALALESYEKAQIKALWFCPTLLDFLIFPKVSCTRLWRSTHSIGPIFPHPLHKPLPENLKKIYSNIFPYLKYYRPFRCAEHTRTAVYPLKESILC